jgi:hypothetical protein
MIYNRGMESRLLTSFWRKTFNLPVKLLQQYDLCFAWNWEYDADFAEILNGSCQAQGLSILQVTPNNLHSVMNDLVNNQITFAAYFDRASDSDPNFNSLVLWARQQSILRINPFRLARRAWNKAAMHQKLLEAGLYAPFTMVLPSYWDRPSLDPLNLNALGEIFTIKPAHGGGGVGVIIDATCWEQVLTARQEYPNDQYLLQEHVFPVTLDERQAWFRVIYCAGEVFPCWWDPHSHLYTALNEDEINNFNLHALLKISHTIAGICQLELFSTEIAMNASGHFAIVDYVNDPIDLRPQSKAAEGVPDQVLWSLAGRLATFISGHCNGFHIHAS